jgi:GSH-dependent disulfide-bond oxidoreductase
MIKLFFHTSPNPLKVALFLEESGLPYELIPIDVRKGEQFNPEFVEINPNSKLPAVLDDDVRVFDSSAILLYLAEKTGLFLAEKTPQARAELLSWLLFVASGVGPYTGQAAHFKYFAPQGLEYALDRYVFEARRHFRILDERLRQREFILGDAYSIVDMSAWGWTQTIPFILGTDEWRAFPNLKRWFDAVNSRPAAMRTLALKQRFAFKEEMDAEARRALFRHPGV